MKPGELVRHRQNLDMTIEELATALRLRPGGERDLRRMEAGTKDITGPIAVAVELMWLVKSKELSWNGFPR